MPEGGFCKGEGLIGDVRLVQDEDEEREKDAEGKSKDEGKAVYGDVDKRKDGDVVVDVEDAEFKKNCD